MPVNSLGEIVLKGEIMVTGEVLFITLRKNHTNTIKATNARLKTLVKNSEMNGGKCSLYQIEIVMLDDRKPSINTNVAKMCLNLVKKLLKLNTAKPYLR